MRGGEHSKNAVPVVIQLLLYRVANAKPDLIAAIILLVAVVPMWVALDTCLDHEVSLLEQDAGKAAMNLVLRSKNAFKEWFGLLRHCSRIYEKT